MLTVHADPCSKPYAITAFLINKEIKQESIFHLLFCRHTYASSRLRLSSRVSNLLNFTSIELYTIWWMGFMYVSPHTYTHNRECTNGAYGAYFRVVSYSLSTVAHSSWKSRRREDREQSVPPVGIAGLQHVFITAAIVLLFSSVPGKAYSVTVPTCVHIALDEITVSYLPVRMSLPLPPPSHRRLFRWKIRGKKVLRSIKVGVNSYQYRWYLSEGPSWLTC